LRESSDRLASFVCQLVAIGAFGFVKSGPNVMQPDITTNGRMQI